MTPAAGPDIFEAYLSGAAAGLFGSHFLDAADRRRAVERAMTRPLTPAIADLLAEQNAALAPSPARDAHIAALRAGAVAVVTGQQAGLFLGPLFTVYKAASAVCCARALAAESGRPVVPVFWLQTEDHDLPEIAVCHVPRARGAPLTVRLPASPQEHIAIAHRTLPEAVDACVNELRGELVSLPYAEQHLSRIARYYRPGVGWGAAFAGLLAELFAPEGLVLIDPRVPAVAAAAAPVHRQALAAAEPLAAALAARGEALQTAGFATTVHVRPGAPLSFFHPDGPLQRRVRLVPAPEGFVEVGGERGHTRAALLDALAVEPMCFSSSALLRPIVQDSILPTAAYVGGPAEVGYFAQLAPLYDAYALPMPLVVPRARVRLLEDKTVRLLTRLRLAPDDARCSEDDLLAAPGQRQAHARRPDELVKQLLAPFDAALAGARADLEEAGPGLTTAVDKTRATVEMAISKLAAKYDHALLHRNQRLVDDVRRIKELLYPGGIPQERVYGLAYFAARYGERTCIERVLSAIDPFAPDPRDVTLADVGGEERAAEVEP